MSLAVRCASLPKGTRALIAFVLVPATMLAVGALLISSLVWSLQSQTHWREEVRQTLRRANAASLDAATITQDLEAVRHSADWHRFYPVSVEGMGSAAAMQSEISALFQGARVNAQSLVLLPAIEHEHFTQLGVRVTSSVRLDELESILSALATHPRFIRVQRLSITAPHSQSRDQNPPLAVTLELAAFSRGEAHASIDEQSAPANSMAHSG